MQNSVSFISFFARQPIFDSNKKTFAFELLYRSVPVQKNQYPTHQDGTIATLKLIQNSIFMMGLQKVTGGKTAFINFTKDSLMENITNLLNPKHFVIELLEDIEESEELLEVLSSLKKNGFNMALDDFVIKKTNINLIKYAEYIKIDVLTTPLDEAGLIIKKLRDNKIKFIAEKVENYECFECCKEIGFDYFQGYFFSKPEILSCRDIPVSKLNIFNLLRIVSKDEIDIRKTSSVIERDPGLTYKLLKLVNSAAFYFERNINSVTHAIVILGEREIRKWVTIIALSNLIDDKPNEILITSCLRAKFCEYIALDVLPQLREEAFLTGLLSMLDVILCMPMEKILDELPISQSIKDALIKRKGPLAFFLELVKKYETMDALKVALLCDKMRIERERLLNYYIESSNWANYFYNI